MPRNPAVTAEDIREIADALYGELKRLPTNDEVRKQLGRGSMSTISPVMEGWRREQLQGEHVDPLQAGIQQLREQLEADARRSVQADEARLAKERAIAEDRITEAVTAQQRSEAAWREIRETLTCRDAQYEECNRLLVVETGLRARAEGALEILTTRCTEAEAKVMELQAEVCAAGERIATLASDLRDALVRQQETAEAFAAAQAHTAEVKAEYCALQTELPPLQQALNECKQARGAVEQALQDECKAHAATQAALYDAEQGRRHDRDSLELQLRQTMTERAGLRERLALLESTLEAERSRYHSEMVTARDQLARLATESNTQIGAVAVQLQALIAQQAAQQLIDAEPSSP